MTKAEITRKFDEMVDFSGVERYIDTPVKRYSSGMYVRLAFSVAAFLESEILIVDEVLAVGDSVFQRKCIDKMMDIGKQGRTIFFVSHNLSSIRFLCERGILMHNGMLIEDNQIDNIIESYTRQSLETKTIVDLRSLERNHPFKSLSFNAITFNSMPFKFGESIRFSLQVEKHSDEYLKDLDFGLAIKDLYNNQLIHISNRFINKHFDWGNGDFNEFKFSIENNLKAGFYYLQLFLRANDVIQDWLSEKVMIEIEDGNPYGFNDSSQIQGVILPQFTINNDEESDF